MAMLHYFKRKNPEDLTTAVPSLSAKEVEKVNESVKKERESVSAKRVKYNDYSASERAQIGKYAAENGPTRAVQHFSKTLSMKIPETTARRLKAEYMAALKVEKKEVRGSEVP